MPAETPKRPEPIPWLRVLVLLVFGATMAVQAAMIIWSVATSTRFGRVWIGCDFRMGDWWELVCIRSEGGFRLAGVDVSSPLGRAGLRDGDLIVAANGRRVLDHPDAWIWPFFRGQPGDTLTLTYISGSDVPGVEKQAAAIEAVDPVQGGLAWEDVWTARGDTARAESALRRVAGLDTSAVQRPLFRLGLLLALQGRYAEAADVYRRILVRNPQDMSVVFQLGIADLNGKLNGAEAESCFRRVLEAESKGGGGALADVHYRLGLLHDQQGRHAEAISELKKAVELEPHVQLYARELWRVERKK